jgi:hypothetical protein
MSSLISTQAMVTELGSRVPIGLDSTFAINRLNSAYRWIETQGSFSWNLLKTTLSLTMNTLAVALPTGTGVVYNPGKLAVIYGVGYRLQFLPMEEFAMYRSSSGASGQPFSVWTHYNVPGTGYSALFGPDAAMNTTGATSFDLYYHRQTPAALTSGASTYFPTPDEFDDLILDMAEAECRRLYSLAGWEKIQSKATDSAMRILDQYRTTKEGVSGTTDSMKRREDKNADTSRKAKD